jgi:predicted Zn-dependent peptidase
MNKFSDGFPTSDDRDEIEESLINHVIEGMDMSTLVQFAREALYKAYADYTDNDLLEEVERFAPHLLDLEEEIDD